MSVKEKLKSDRLWALAGFIGVAIANSTLGLHLDVPSAPDGTSPLMLIAINVGAFILGKSIRGTSAGAAALKAIAPVAAVLDDTDPMPKPTK